MTIGLLTDQSGFPLTVSAFEGNKAQSKTRFRRHRRPHRRSETGTGTAAGAGAAAGADLRRTGGGTYGFLAWLTNPARRLAYSVGLTITDDIAAAILALPNNAWNPAYDNDREVRDGRVGRRAYRMLELSSWAKGRRLIVRKERPHPGAQLRFTDLDANGALCLPPAPKQGS
jgi:hypothetical protein